MADMIRFTNIKQFEVDLDRFAEKVGVSLDFILRKVGFDIFAAVVTRTPVDTGYARANWVISTNRIDRTTKPKASYPAGVDNSGKAERDNLAMAASVRPDKNRTSIWITNSVPYIVFLEQGRTVQLDKGKGFMVQRAMAEITNDIQKAIKEFR